MLFFQTDLSSFAQYIIAFWFYEVLQLIKFLKRQKNNHTQNLSEMISSRQIAVLADINKLKS